MPPIRSQSGDRGVGAAQPLRSRAPAVCVCTKGCGDGLLGGGVAWQPVVRMRLGLTMILFSGVDLQRKSSNRREKQTRLFQDDFCRDMTVACGSNGSPRGSCVEVFV